MEVALVRQEKEKDKNETSEDTIVCYDLQAVIPLPNGNVSTFYYKSKLNVYNFTVFDIKSKQAYFHIQHETVAKRGADYVLVTTCVFWFLTDNCTGKKFIFYSDNCVAQNKNKFLLGMYLYCVTHMDIKSITHKYLIIGHTENEGDSMHSCIEREKKEVLMTGSIYVPSEIANARKVENLIW